MIKHFAPAALALALASSPPAQAASGPLGNWKVVSIDGARPISRKAHVDITATRISASAGCNGLGGEYTLAGSRLMTGPFVSTMMFCDGLMDQEQAIAKLLEAKPAWRIQSNKLIMAGGGHRLVLVRR